MEPKETEEAPIDMNAIVKDLAFMFPGQVFTMTNTQTGEQVSAIEPETEEGNA